MPKTKFAMTVLKPDKDCSWFEKTIKKRMIEQDTWYQGIDKKVGRSAQSLRAWVKDPETFRLGDLVEFLKALEFSPEEREQIVIDLVSQMAGERREQRVG